MSTNTVDTPIATCKQGPFGRRISLYRDRISKGSETHPLAGVRAEVTSSGGAVTGTRFLMISGPDFYWQQRTDGVFEGKCRKFAAAINQAAQKVA